MTVVSRNFQVRPVLPLRRLDAVVRVAGSAVRGGLGTVGFAFVDDAGMARHHGHFTGDPTTTDVLSFPDESAADDEAEQPGPGGVEAEAPEPPYWGDVIICTDQAVRQARALGHPYRYELAVLALHGVLHLLGFDHTRDQGQMRRLEHALRPRSIVAGRER